MKKDRPFFVSAFGVAVSLSLCIPCLAQNHGTDVASTRHNLSATGPGPVRVEGSAGVCRFCHTPHSANPIAPLWNRDDPGTYYQTYESTTLVADVGQPTGSSRLCLSCHDGTIALTQTYNPRNAPGGSTVFITSADRGFIGTDLGDDHPISFTYDSGLAMLKGNLRDPSTLPPQLPLDHENRVQCATCHEPHDDSFGHFLRMDNTASGLCISCHDQEGWATSAHATSPASLAGSVEIWDNLEAATVREAACESCHRPHTAGGRQRLLRREAEEENCMACHDGSVARTDLRAALNALSTHPVRLTTGVHDPAENPATMSEHVECADCHNPHRTASSGPAQAPFIKPSMAGAIGVTNAGLTPGEAQYEYEVCYKCHGSRNVSTPTIDRVFDNSDIAKAFQPANASYHPVEAQGRNPGTVSLLQNYNAASIIYCTDCHGSDDPNGASGPHGSRYEPLLKNNYTTRDNTVESPLAYAMCYQCHNRASILGDETFPEHKMHIVDENTSCATCHDPHGVRENTHLINFDRSVVEPASNGVGPTFNDLGKFEGSCTLSCHGRDHIDQRY
ncbi:MAG: cytochrome c3 family protein [Phycisphaerales bacterium]